MNSGSFEAIRSKGSNMSAEQDSRDAIFLQRLISKRENQKEWVCPFSEERCEYIGTRPNASYRQQYLRMYNPMKTNKKKQSLPNIKRRFKKWFAKTFFPDKVHPSIV